MKLDKILQSLKDISGYSREALSRPTFWVVNCGVVAICCLSGPFGTLEALPGGLRLIYWGLIVVTSSTLALHLCILMRALNWVAWPEVLLVSLGFGVIIAALVILVSLALLQPTQSYPGTLELVGYSFPSATGILFLSMLVSNASAAPQNSDNEKRPALFARLTKYPHAQQILSLSAQDHYVQIVTEFGQELCLIRLSDAIQLTRPIPGFQVHRSHWVAKSAVKEVDDKGSAPTVLLLDGRRLNVSQSRLEEFRGFLNADSTRQCNLTNDSLV